MSKEQKSMEKPTSTTSDGNNGRKRGRFMGIIIAAVVLIAVLIGVSVYNAPSNRMSRHLDLGARYLEEQNYEQAIVEFDQVIAIDPMSVDAYLGKAQAYEGMGDTEKAIETLVTGYEKTGDEQILGTVGDCLTDYIEQLIAEERYDEAKALIEKYRDKVPGVDFQAYLDEIEELQTAKEREKLLADIPKLDIRDIKILGYDLMEPHFEEIVAASGYSGDNSDGPVKVNVNPEAVVKKRCEYDTGRYLVCYSEESYSPEDYRRLVGIHADKEVDYGDYDLGAGGTWCEVPISIGDTYEQWCEVVGADLIKSFPDVEKRGDDNNALYTITDDSGEVIIRYLESGSWNDMTINCEVPVKENDVDTFRIVIGLRDGIIWAISYDACLYQG